MTRSFVCEVTVQTHLKLDVFLYAEAYKNRSFTAFDAREAYWNRRTRRYMYTPSTGRVLLLWFCKEIAVLPTVTKQPRMS